MNICFLQSEREEQVVYDCMLSFKLGLKRVHGIKVMKFVTSAIKRMSYQSRNIILNFFFIAMYM